MSKVYQIVTDSVIGLLKKGVIPWRRSWYGETTSPRNLKRYRGINAFSAARKAADLILGMTGGAA